MLCKPGREKKAPSRNFPALFKGTNPERLMAVTVLEEA